MPRTKLPLNGRKPENKSLLRKKNRKEMMTHNETRVVMIKKIKTDYKRQKIRLNFSTEDAQIVT